MAWGWKLAGALLGGSLGGPLGAGVGAIIGHFFDAASAQSDEDRTKATALYCVALFLGRVAHADGRIDPRERQLAYSIVRELADNLGVSQPDPWIRSLVDLAFESFVGLDAVLAAGRSNEEFRAVLIRYGWRIAAKDGRITNEEVEFLVRAAQAMGASEAEIYAHGLLYYRSDEADEERRRASHTLGVPYDASQEQVKRAYRELAMKYHPDRHATAPDELRQLAAERFAAIHQAYQVLTEGPGARLLYGLDPATGYLCTMGDDDIAQCFLCGAKCRLPQTRYQAWARCGKCQALLLFEQEIAELLRNAAK